MNPPPSSHATPEPTAAAPALRPEVLALLRCPETGQRLKLEGSELVSADGARRYPIRDGLPVLVPQDIQPQSAPPQA